MVIIRLILSLIQAVLRVSVQALQAGMSLLGVGLLAVAAVAGVLFALSSLGVFGFALRRRSRSRDRQV